MNNCVIDRHGQDKKKNLFLSFFLVRCSLMLKLCYLFMYWLISCLSPNNSRWHTTLPLSSFPHRCHCGLNCHFLYIYSTSHGRKLKLSNLVGRIFLKKIMCGFIHRERDKRVEAAEDPTVCGIFLVMEKKLQLNHIMSRYANMLNIFSSMSEIRGTFMCPSWNVYSVWENKI